MPNWVDNMLYLSGPRKAVDAALEAIRAVEGDAPIDFERIVPMPKPLNIESDNIAEAIAKALTLADDKVSQGEAERFTKNRGAPAFERREEWVAWLKEHEPKTWGRVEVMLNNLKAYGATTWEDWSYDNWGTKWNAEQPQMWRTSRGATLEFGTAWAPPEPAIRTLARQHPQLTVRLRYYESGNGFQGELKLKGEEVLEEWDDEYHGHRGG